MTGEYLNAAGCLGLGFNPYITGGYSGSIAMEDLFNNSYSMGGLYNPMMSMDGSLFNNMTNPYSMLYTGNNWTQQMQQMDQWQDYNINRQVRYNQRYREADLQMNSATEGIKEAAKILRKKVYQDEQDQIIPALNSYIATVKTAYPNAADEEVKTRALSLYSQMFGVDLTDEIRSNGKDSFTQSFINTMSFGLFGNKKTAEDTIAEIDDQPIGKKEKTKKIAGRIAGGTLIGGVGTTLLGFSKYFKFLGKSRSLWGALAGAVIAGVTALSSGSSS